jgi:hypothetical protein
MMDCSQFGYMILGLEKTWLDKWNEVRDHRVIEEWLCPYSIRWEGVPYWPDGPEFQCSKMKGHSGKHKWYGSDKHGDYDLWANSRYDYQLEEL